MLALLPDSPTRKQNFSQMARRMSSLSLGVDAAGFAGGEQRLRTRRAFAVVFAEHHALHGAGLRNHAGLADRGRHIGNTAHHRIGAEDLAQRVVLLNAVLERNDAGLRRHDRQQRARGTFSVPELDAEEDHVDRSDGARIVGGVHLGQMQRLVRAVDGEAVGPHRFKMCAAGNERDVGAAPREPRAEIAADPARTHNGNTQRSLLQAVIAPRRLKGLAA